tara:strand:+ start:64 stop:327 length:264 start_codon:yes stop_codon:yes gene_type:complete
MIERRVTRTKKDKDGDTLALCNSGDYWSPRSKADAINDIESGSYGYYVLGHGGTKTKIEVVKGQTGKYLRSVKDGSTGNNLDELPDC